MTKELFYQNTYQTEFTAIVLSCVFNKGRYEVILDRTCFYPEGGGQSADMGFLDDVRVFDVHTKDNEIIHYCEKELEVGKAVCGKIDWDRRFDFMQQHSGEHIVSGLICQKFHCDNVGFHLGDEVVTIDFNAEMNLNDVLEIEELANRYIQKNISPKIWFPDETERKTLDYRSKKELTGDIRIVEFPEADICACCGTHVKNTGEIGIIKFLSCKNYKGGVRLEVVSGYRAYRYLLENWKQNLQISQKLSAQYFETSNFVDKILQNSMELKQRNTALLEEKHQQMARQYANAGDVLLVEEEMDSLTLRKLCESIHQTNNGSVTVFSGKEGSYKYVIMDDSLQLVSNLKEMNTILQGKGGGKGNFAQGSVNCTKEEIYTFFRK